MKKNPNDNEVPKHRSGKNKRKWCKGKVGVLHFPVWRKSVKYDNFDWLEYCCTACGKELDLWVSVYWRKQSYAKPEIGSTEPLKKLDEKNEETKG